MGRRELIERLYSEIGAAMDRYRHFDANPWYEGLPRHRRMLEKQKVMQEIPMLFDALDALICGDRRVAEGFLHRFTKTAADYHPMTHPFQNPPLVQEVVAHLAINGIPKRAGKKYQYQDAVYKIILKMEITSGLSFNEAAKQVLKDYPELNESRDIRSIRRWYDDEVKRSRGTQTRVTKKVE